MEIHLVFSSLPPRISNVDNTPIIAICFASCNVTHFPSSPLHNIPLNSLFDSINQILSLVSESLLMCQVSARSMRLRCMETLVGGMEEGELHQAAESILAEVS